MNKFFEYLLRSIKIFLVPLAIVISPPCVNASSVNLLGHSISIPSPDGYCELENSEPDDELVSNVKTTLLTGKQIIAIFADCNELRLFRKNSNKQIKNFAWIFYVAKDGVLVEYKRETRASFIKKMSGVDFNAAFKEATVKILKGSPEKELTGKFSKDKFVNDDGIFIGLKSRSGDLTGQLRNMNGVVGMYASGQHILNP